MINGNYLEQHLPELEGLLSPDDARASRLDPVAFVEFLRELNQRGWRDDLHCAFILYRSDDPRQIPVALAIATKKQYRDGIRRPLELDWDSTNRYRAIDDQWCLEYLVRSSDHRGTGAGCFVLARLLHHLAHQLQQAMIWLIVAGGSRPDALFPGRLYGNIAGFRKNSRHVHLHWPRSWTASSKVLSTTTTCKFHNTFVLINTPS